MTTPQRGAQFRVDRLFTNLLIDARDAVLEPGAKSRDVRVRHQEDRGEVWLERPLLHHRRGG